MNKEILERQAAKLIISNSEFKVVFTIPPLSNQKHLFKVNSPNFNALE